MRLLVFFLCKVVITYYQIYFGDNKRHGAWSSFLIDGNPGAGQALLPVFDQCDRWTGQIDSQNFERCKAPEKKKV